MQLGCTATRDYREYGHEAYTSPYVLIDNYGLENGESKYARQRVLIAKAASRLDETIDEIGSCLDGYCVIKRPKGQHTNGGCRCTKDCIRMQRFSYAMNNFAKEVKDAIND